MNKEIEKLIETKEKDIKRLGRECEEKEDYDLKGATYHAKARPIVSSDQRRTRLSHWPSCRCPLGNCYWSGPLLLRI